MHGICFFSLQRFEKFLHFSQKFQISNTNVLILKKNGTNGKSAELLCDCIFRKYLLILRHVLRPSKFSEGGFWPVCFDFFFIFKNIKCTDLR